MMYQEYVVNVPIILVTRVYMTCFCYQMGDFVVVVGVKLA